MFVVVGAIYRSGRAGLYETHSNWLTPVGKGGSRTAPTLADGLFYALLYPPDHEGYKNQIIEQSDVGAVREPPWGATSTVDKRGSPIVFHASLCPLGHGGYTKKVEYLKIQVFDLLWTLINPA